MYLAKSIFYITLVDPLNPEHPTPTSLPQPGRDEGQSDRDEGLEGQTGCDEGQERQSDHDEGQEGQPGRDEGQSNQTNDSREILPHDVQLIIIHDLLRVSPVSRYTLQLVNFFLETLWP